MALTSPPRTVLDCAALIAIPYELERLVAEAAVHRRLVPTAQASRGTTGYETNAVVAGLEVDLLWRTGCLAVQLDGFDAHSGWVAFERDRLKGAT